MPLLTVGTVHSVRLEDVAGAYAGVIPVGGLTETAAKSSTVNARFFSRRI
jgi:hypothetical protein